jgi:hypothetical protein
MNRFVSMSLKVWEQDVPVVQAEMLNFRNGSYPVT